MQILCSTGALIGRPNGRDYHLLETLAPKLSCDGFEFMMYDTWYPQIDEMLPYLQGLRLNIPVLHCEKSLAEHISRGGEEELQEAFRLFHLNCRVAAGLGAKKTVLHLWNGLISDTRFENNLAAYGGLRKTAEEYGIDLLVENVVCLEAFKAVNEDNSSDSLNDIRFAHFYDITLISDGKEIKTPPDSVNVRIEFSKNLSKSMSVDDPEHLKVIHFVEDEASGKAEPEILDNNAVEVNTNNNDYLTDTTFEATGFDKEGTVHTDMLNEQFEWAHARLDRLT